MSVRKEEVKDEKKQRTTEYKEIKIDKDERERV